jgi:hypothetical protein
VAVGTNAAPDRLLSQVRFSGYAVIAHHMREYVELHAVHLSGDEIPHVSHCS